jgi:predicted transcriptional regulator
MASETTRDSVRSVERALAILQCFTLDESALTLMEIARKMDLPMSTTVRIVSTLQKTGFLIATPTRRTPWEAGVFRRMRRAGAFPHTEGRVSVMVQIRDATKRPSPSTVSRGRAACATNTFRVCSACGAWSVREIISPCSPERPESVFWPTRRRRSSNARSQTRTRSRRRRSSTGTRF